jgi:hypothetical protein
LREGGNGADERVLKTKETVRLDYLAFYASIELASDIPVAPKDS